MKPVHNRDLAGRQNLKTHSQLWLTGTLGTEQPTFKKKAGQQTDRQTKAGHQGPLIGQ